MSECYLTVFKRDSCTEECSIYETCKVKVTTLQGIIYSALMDSKYTNKHMLDILDDTCEWIEEEFYMLEYNSSTQTKKGDE